MKRFLAVLLIVAGTIVSATSAYADNTKISPELLNQPSNQQAQVIIQYAPGTQLTCTGLLGLLDCVLNDVVQLGGTILGQLPLINGLVAQLDGNGIQSLSNQSNVVYISSDRPLAPSDNNANGAINAQFAWQSGYSGAGVGVALIDSGVYSHPDLYQGILPFSRVVYQQSFVPGNSSTNDQYGHGTHVAGLIAGDGLSSTGPSFSQTFKGLAPGANIVNLRVLDQNGAGTDSLVIAAINQAISLKSRYNIRVINLSLGRAIYESYKLDPLCQAVEQAWKNGIVVVVAAGNNGRYQPTDGYATVTSPGNDPYVITVGDMKPMGTPTRVDDLIASYSSKGPTVVDAVVKPDLVAPGNLLVSLEAPNSTLYNEFPTDQVPYSYYVNGGSSAISPTYFQLSGTSMATGIVSGVVADVLQKSPNLTPDQVKARLMLTAYKTFPQSSSTTDPTTGITYTDQYDVFTIGAGYVDVEAALNSTALAKGTAMSPIATFNSNTNEVTLTDDPSAVWNTSSTWSNTAVWGASQFVTGATTTSTGAPPHRAARYRATKPSGAPRRYGAAKPSGAPRRYGEVKLSGAATSPPEKTKIHLS
ncbi:MAG: S8 family peptidase [Candidatus Sulfotelmatobacter sp.]